MCLFLFLSPNTMKYTIVLGLSKLITKGCSQELFAQTIKLLSKKKLMSHNVRHAIDNSKYFAKERESMTYSKYNTTIPNTAI